jgi:hypothetical protein
VDAVPDADVKEFGAARRDLPDERTVYCDRCGAPMIELNCKIVCLNCGNRLDCSDLTIYMD